MPLYASEGGALCVAASFIIGFTLGANVRTIFGVEESKDGAPRALKRHSTWTVPKPCQSWCSEREHFVFLWNG